MAALLLIGFPWAIAAPVPSQSQEPAPAQATTPAPPDAQLGHWQSGEVTEDRLKQFLVGKQLFLRGGYLGDSLSFTEHGAAIGHPAVGSYTLSAVEIEKVHLTKHKVELEGARYALHFLGTLPYEDPKAIERVKITSKKKVLKITIDREQVAKSKKEKESKKKAASQAAKEPIASSETDVAGQTPASEPAPAPDQAQAQAQDQAADQASVTTTLSPAHAANMLHEALDRVLAPNLDDKIRAQMPEFWQLYYQAQAAGVEYRPHDPAVLRSSAVDQQAKVLKAIAPDSNEYAQANAVAGRALYRVVIGTDGKPGEIAVIRPIGFGLDENAVAAIRKAAFEPAIKSGKPVAETLDLAVVFRIYAMRTSLTASDNKPAEQDKPVLPGPYSVKPQ